MLCPAYSYSGGLVGGGYGSYNYQPWSRNSQQYSSGQLRRSDFSHQYSSSSLPPTRGLSLPRSSLQSFSPRQKSVFRLSAGELPSADPDYRFSRLKSPSIPRERTRDELIDSIVHTRTREHRVLPGYKSATDYDERRSMKIDCDKVHKGIIIGNGETICNIDYLKSIGVTHVLNTAEQHVIVNPGKYSCHGIQYFGFHVDDLPECNISRYFHSSTSFIESAVNSGGLVVVNCVMGWSRSATCVAAYLIMRHGLKATKALELIRQNRAIRPNAGFLQQLADLENTLAKRVSW